jgi:hypothetical protein
MTSHLMAGALPNYIMSDYRMTVRFPPEGSDYQTFFSGKMQCALRMDLVNPESAGIDG